MDIDAHEPPEWGSESGQTMAEYAVVLAIITLTTVTVLGLLATGASDVMTDIIGNL